MDQKLRLGVIGLGRRAASLLPVFRGVYAGLTVGAVADPDRDSARERLRGAELLERHTAFFTDVDELLDHAGDLDALMIGTRCNIHTPMAVKAAATGLPLYLEKPVAVSYEQIAALRDAYRGREKSVVVSFPMRMTPLFRAVMEVVESGRLGAVNQVQAFNYVPYGGTYYSLPTYRDVNVTGGMWLQKATHDFDYLNTLLGTPTAVSAVMTRMAYGGDMPHGLRCSGCDRACTCPESPAGIARRGDDGGSRHGRPPLRIRRRHRAAGRGSGPAGVRKRGPRQLYAELPLPPDGRLPGGHHHRLPGDAVVRLVHRDGHRDRPSSRPRRHFTRQGDYRSPRRRRGPGA